MANRIWDMVKNIVIVLLLVSIACLAIIALPTSIVTRLPLPDKVASVLGVEASQPTLLSPGQEVTAAATPLMISLNHEGGRHTVRRDEAALQSAYELLSGLLGAALHSADHGKSITEADFAAAMNAPSALFSFDGNIPATALSRWLTGADTAAVLSASDYLLTKDGRDVSLLLLGPTPMQYTTTLSTDALLSAVSTFPADGSGFASPESGLSPLTLWEQDVVLPTYVAENPVTADYALRLATELDFNPYGTGTYTDPAGNTVFTETSRTLSVSASGEIVITTDGEGITRFTAADGSAAAKIELVRSLLDTMTHGLGGEQHLQLQSMDETECTFTYVLGGVPVAPAACRVTFRDNTLAELTFSLQVYTHSAVAYRLMPLRAAAAISPAGTRLMPAISPAGGCGWTVQ